MDSPHIRSVLADLAAKVRATTGQTDNDYSDRQAAYDLRKLRAHHLLVKPGRTRRYHVPTDAVRTIAAITTLRDHVIEPLLGGLHRQPPTPNPATWTAVEHDYDTLRTHMHTLFDHLGIATPHHTTTLRTA